MRRRKPKVVWLPTTNANAVDGAGGVSAWNIASVNITPNGTAGVTGVIEVPIVMDGPASDPLAATSSLADIESSGYRLRRIVGKLYAFLAQSNDTGTAEELWGVDAGFIIRRVNPSTGGSNAAVASAATAFDQIDPSQVDNTMDPWIWRRSWILSNGADANGVGANPLSNGFQAAFSRAGGTSNYGKQYPGGNLEGPHVDQKTARIVGPEERLFLDVSATDIIGNNSATSLVIFWNLRVLASMRQNIGNRRNASR